MSFRGRLTGFFVLIVIIPMISVAFVLFRLISDNEQGKTDARVAARQDVAINSYYDARERADKLAVEVGGDVGLSEALRDGDPAGVQREVERLRRSTGARRISISKGSTVIADDGAKLAIFPATRDLLAGSERIGQLQVAVQGAQEYARLVRRVTSLDVVIRRGDEVLAATLDGSGKVQLPARTGIVDVGDEEYRAAAFTAPGFLGERVRVGVLEAQARTASDTGRSRRLAGGILAGFFILAFTFAVLVSRSLQRQIEGFLVAAKRLGAGDFSAEVPTSGRDEFAALGQEFNKMSRQLEARLEDLRQERARLELSLRRIGDTFASNLDRKGLLEIVVQTAVDGVGADAGRATARTAVDTPMRQVARFGQHGDQPEVAKTAEQEARRTGEPSSAEQDGMVALAHPLRTAGAEGEAPRVMGVVSVWRAGAEFSESARELFHYLAGQAAVSIENVGLHEVVERQATTDELTGLSNRRRFQETMDREAERSKRFGQDLGLMMLDIDNFKKVNDTFGHQQGDLVLKEVARVLKETSREIDEPARYGGEELAVVLPGTDLEGAFNLAERVREGIEELELPVLGDNGTTMRVTASFGVAALPTSADDLRSLVAAADAALYEAKRAGKNRTHQAG